jgi:hypothetical protein
MALRLLAALLALAPAAQAETYKWVDERGVVNYSNTPPPAAAKAAQPVAERVSTYETDPATRAIVARGVTPYESMIHREWMQRQRLLAESQNLDKVIAAAPAPQPVFYPAVFTRPALVRTVRPVHRRGRPPRTR